MWPADMGVARQTVHGWLRRYADQGLAGLVDPQRRRKRRSDYRRWKRDRAMELFISPDPFLEPAERTPWQSCPLRVVPRDGIWRRAHRRSMPQW